MKIRITVTYRGLALSEAAQSEIVQQVKRLERADADILLCHVYVERGDDQVHGYHADVQLTMRGGDSLASHRIHDELRCDDLHAALRFAFEDVAQQLAATRLRRFQPPRRERSAASGW